LFPKLPERTRLFRLLTVHRDWTARFLAAPSLLGVADTYGVELSPKPLEPTGREVGVDVGVHHLVATSDGATKDNPQWYRAEQAELRVLQRRVSRRQLGGSNRHKAVAALQRQHERIANRRKDYLNKLAVSGTSSPVAVASGAALVYGIPYVNTASVNVAVSTPSVSTRMSWSRCTTKLRWKIC